MFAPWGCALAEGLIRRFPAQEPAFRLAPIGKYAQPGKAQVGAARAVVMARGARGRKRPQTGKTGVRAAVWAFWGPKTEKTGLKTAILVKNCLKMAAFRVWRAHAAIKRAGASKILCGTLWTP